MIRQVQRATTTEIVRFVRSKYITETPTIVVYYIYIPIEQ